MPLRRHYGGRQSTDQRAKAPTLSLSMGGGKTLPPSVDLSVGWGSARNQETTESCTAFAAAAAMEYIALKNGLPASAQRLSPLFVYYWARDLAFDDVNVDDGLWCDRALEALWAMGIAPEDMWPFKDKDGKIPVSTRPSKEANDAAAKYTVNKYDTIEVTDASIKAALASGVPVLMGLMLHNGALETPNAEATGNVAVPLPSQTAANHTESHTVLLVGYDDTGFRFRNSWGEGWGAKGYGKLPYGYHAGLRFDARIITEVKYDGNVIPLLKPGMSSSFGLVRAAAPRAGPVVSPTPIPVSAGAVVGEKLSFVKLSGLKADNATYVATDVQTGYATTGSVGAVVQIGTSAKLTFEMTLKAVTTSDIMDLDSSLTENMSEDEHETYSKAVQQYGGGFDVPLLSWFGINANASYSKEDVESARQANSHYDRQAKDVSQALSQKTEQVITVRGELTATGVSFIPTEVSAYIKVAQIKLSNGTTLNVINTNTPDGVQAADADGKAVPTTGQKLQKITLGAPRAGAGASGGSGMTNRGDRLVVGQHLDEGECLTTTNGTYTLSMQADGNLVLYDTSSTPRALWVSNTLRRPESVPQYVELQADGNLVMYRADRSPLWASNTASADPKLRPVTARLMDDGSFVLYDMYDNVRWATGTGNA